MKIARPLLILFVLFAGTLLIWSPNSYSVTTRTWVERSQGVLNYTRRHSYSPDGFVVQTPSRRTTRQPVQAADSQKQEVLTNDSIIRLLKAGIDEDLIIAKVQKTKHSFDLSTDGLIALKQSGATSRLIQFMMDPSKPPTPKRPPNQALNTGSAELAAPTRVATPTTAEFRSGYPTEVGVSVKREGKWVEIQPEAVNWKIGSGMLRNLRTLGKASREDVNGRVQGPKSPNRLVQPLELLVLVPEGVAIVEYRLVRLHEHKDYREFRTVRAAGLIYTSEGATRDLVEFQAQKLESRKFLITLSKLAAGEYGLLPPGGATAASTGSIGKMYTFSLIE